MPQQTASALLDFSGPELWMASHGTLSCALDAIALAHPAASALSLRWDLAGERASLGVERPRHLRVAVVWLDAAELSEPELARALGDPEQAHSMLGALRAALPLASGVCSESMDWAARLGRAAYGTLGLGSSLRVDADFPDGLEPGSQQVAEALESACAELESIVPGLALRCLVAGSTFLSGPARQACAALAAEFEAQELEGDFSGGPAEPAQETVRTKLRL